MGYSILRYYCYRLMIFEYFVFGIASLDSFPTFLILILLHLIYYYCITIILYEVQWQGKLWQEA